jgi:urease accessory protein
MLRATSVKPKGGWTGAVADTVVLDYDDRHRRRMAMTGVQGTGFLLDLPEAMLLRGGDALVLEDGRLIEVVAAPEPLAEIRVASPADLVRVAWHLGNRHLPTQVAGNKLRIRRDHVIEAMLQGLGARVAAIEAPFDPEGGAYAGGSHEEDHAHSAHDHHDHDHHDHPAHDHQGHEHDGHDHDHPDHAEHGPRGGQAHAHDHDHESHRHGREPGPRAGRGGR